MSKIFVGSIVFIILFYLVGYINGNIPKNELSRLINPSNQIVKLPATNQEIKLKPIYIKLEVEDFTGVGTEGSTSAWQQNMSWYPQWSRGGASGWWGVKGSPTATTGEIIKDIYIPEDGKYLLWMRYQDYVGKAEPFTVVVQNGGDSSKVGFGQTDIATQSHSQIPWNYVWDKRNLDLKKGAAKIIIKLEQAAEVPRALDALVITNDVSWNPKDRGFPPQAYSNYLLNWSKKREPLKPLIELNKELYVIPQAWSLPKTAERDFWYFGAREMISGYPFPINIQPEIGNPNSAVNFAAHYKENPQAAPIFSSPITGIQIPISQIRELLKDDNPLRQYILNNKRPFVIVGNYGSAGNIPNSYQELKQIFGNLWVGIINGENSYLGIPLSPENISNNFNDANYQWLLNNGKSKWQQMISSDWSSSILNPFEKTIAALSVGTMPHVHQFAESGMNTLAAESAGASPYIPIQLAFVRGAGRQYRKPWAWYFGASFGDAIRTFTNEDPYTLELEGLRINDRNTEIGPSLAHIRRTLLFSYLQGASFFHPEQGFNLFDSNGQLNPMGWSYDEMIRLATKHPNRGVINTPVAILLDKAHGWDKYTYNGMRLWDKKPLERSDQMINQFFNIAYFPFPKNEGDPVNDLNVPFPNGYFGDIFDVLVTSPTQMDSLQSYPVVFCVGDTNLDTKWAERLKKYVTDGGTLVINAEQAKARFDESFFGAKLLNEQKESATVICNRDNEEIDGTPYPYQKAIPISAQIIARASNGDPIAFLNKVGKGQVILTTPSYLLGYDEVAIPYMAHLLLEITSGLEPVEVRGDCQYFVNLRPDGYVVTLSNNEGLVKMSHSPAKMDMSKTTEIALQIKDKPLVTEDWIGEEPRPWIFPNEWLPEYTQPKNILWRQEGKSYKITVKLLPGEIRIYFIKTINLKIY